MLHRLVRPIFTLVLVFALLHFVRDVLQDLRVTTFLTTFLHPANSWCGAYCNAITYPFELVILGGSLLVLKRQNVGWLGKGILLVLLVWTAMFLYDVMTP